jgi:hypothetical protein
MLLLASSGRDGNGRMSSSDVTHRLFPNCCLSPAAKSTLGIPSIVADCGSLLTIREKRKDCALPWFWLTGVAGALAEVEGPDGMRRWAVLSLGDLVPGKVLVAMSGPGKGMEVVAVSMARVTGVDAGAAMAGAGESALFGWNGAAGGC